MGDTLPQKEGINQAGDLHYGHLGDRYFEELPYVDCCSSLQEPQDVIGFTSDRAVSLFFFS